MQLQLYCTNYTTPQLQLHHATTTTTAALHHIRSSSCGWGDRPSDCNHCNHSKKHSSNHLLVHQWIRSAIRDSQQPISPIGFLFLKLPPPPCAALLVWTHMDYIPPNGRWNLQQRIITDQCSGSIGTSPVDGPNGAQYGALEEKTHDIVSHLPITFQFCIVLIYFIGEILLKWMIWGHPLF